MSKLSEALKKVTGSSIGRNVIADLVKKHGLSNTLKALSVFLKEDFSWAEVPSFEGDEEMAEAILEELLDELLDSARALGQMGA